MAPRWLKGRRGVLRVALMLHGINCNTLQSLKTLRFFKKRVALGFLVIFDLSH